MSRHGARTGSPLAAFVTARPQGAPATLPGASQSPPVPAERGGFSVWLPLALQQRARACAYWERLTLSRLVEEALADAIDRYEERRGSPYEQAPSPLPSGRPLTRR